MALDGRGGDRRWPTERKTKNSLIEYKPESEKPSDQKANPQSGNLRSKSNYTPSKPIRDHAFHSTPGEQAQHQASPGRCHQPRPRLRRHSQKPLSSVKNLRSRHKKWARKQYQTSRFSERTDTIQRQLIRLLHGIRLH